MFMYSVHTVYTAFYHNEFLLVQLNLKHLLRGGGVHLTSHLHRLPHQTQTWIALPDKL